MDALDSMKISASGLAANRKRIETISSNLANSQTTRTIEGGPYRRKITVFAAEPMRGAYAEVVEGTYQENAQGVYAKETISDNAPPILKYQPDHVDADERGYVAYPNINVMVEMADLMNAQRNYEANANAMNVSKSMAMKALELGRN